MRPICIDCNCEFHCHRNGVVVHVGNNNYHSADMWKCPNCGHEILSGYGKDFYHSDNVSQDKIVADLTEAY